MGPEIFNFQLAPRTLLGERQQLHTFAKPVWYVTVHFDGDFAVASLRFHDARERDEFAGQDMRLLLDDLQREALMQFHAGCTQQSA